MPESQLKIFRLLILFFTALVLTGCKARPFLKAPSDKAPKMKPGQVLRPIYQTTEGYVLRGGGGVVVEWGNTHGVFLSSLSDFGRFYPHRYDLKAYDVSGMVQSVVLTSSVSASATISFIPSLDTSIAQWRVKEAGGKETYDGLRDLIAAKITNPLKIEPVQLAGKNPPAGSVAFSLIYDGESKQQLVRAHVFHVDNFGGFAEVSYAIDPAYGTGWPLLNAAGELIGVMGKIYSIPAMESKLPENRNSATRDIMVAHFIPVERIKSYLEGIK